MLEKVLYIEYQTLITKLIYKSQSVGLCYNVGPTALTEVFHLQHTFVNIVTLKFYIAHRL